MTSIKKSKAKKLPFVEVKKLWSGDIDRVVFTNETRACVQLNQDGASYLVAGTGITIRSGSNATKLGYSTNQVVFESTAGTASGGATVEFNPESVVYAAANNGTVSDYSSGVATIKVYIGGEQLNIDNSSPFAAKTFRVVLGSASNITPGTLTQNNGSSSASTAAPSNMTQDQASIPYSIVVIDADLNSTTYSITQQFTKARKGDTGSTGSPGIDGKNGYFISITPQSISLPTTAGGAVDYTPSGATISAYRGGTQLQGVTTGTPAANQFKVTGVIGTNISPDSTGAVSGTNIVFDDAASIAANAALITYTLSLENILTGVQVIQTFAKSKAGADGSPGATGSAVKVSIDPESITLQAANNGTVSDYTPSGSTIKVYENGIQLNVDNTSTYSNSTFRVNSATGTNITAGAITQVDGASSATVADASNMTNNNASIAHSITVKNNIGSETTYLLTQTLAKARQGADGSTSYNTATINGSDFRADHDYNTGGGDTTAVMLLLDGVVTDTHNLVTVQTIDGYSPNAQIKIDKTGIYKLELTNLKLKAESPTADASTESMNLKVQILQTKNQDFSPGNGDSQGNVNVLAQEEQVIVRPASGGTPAETTWGTLTGYYTHSIVTDDVKICVNLQCIFSGSPGSGPQRFTCLEGSVAPVLTFTKIG